MDEATDILSFPMILRPKIMQCGLRPSNETRCLQYEVQVVCSMGMIDEASFHTSRYRASLNTKAEGPSANTSLSHNYNNYIVLFPSLSYMTQGNIIPEWWAAYLLLMLLLTYVIG